jgi:hypothetical protein
MAFAEILYVEFRDLRRSCEASLNTKVGLPRREEETSATTPTPLSSETVLSLRLRRSTSGIIVLLSQLFPT